MTWSGYLLSLLFFKVCAFALLCLWCVRWVPGGVGSGGFLPSSPGGSHTLTCVNQGSILPFVRAHRLHAAALPSLSDSLPWEPLKAIKNRAVRHVESQLCACWPCSGVRKNRSTTFHSLVLLIFEVIRTIVYLLLTKRSVLLFPG